MQTVQVTVEHASNQALELFNAGKTSAARTLISQILKQRPNHPLMLHLDGVISHQMGDGDKGRKSLLKALEVSPNDVMFLTNTTEIFRRLEDLDLAVAIGNRAVTQAPKSANAWANLGLAYFDQKDFEQAAACQNKALSFNPTHANATNNLGSIAREGKDLDQAISMFRQAIEMQPDYWEAQSNLAVALIEDNQLDEAKAIVSAILAGNPTHAMAHCSAGRIRLLESALDDAERAARATIKHQTDLMDGHLLLSQVLLEKNHPKLALESGLIAEKCNAQNPSVQCQIAKCHSDIGDSDAAMGILNDVLKSDPTHVTALLAKGRIEMEFGEIDTARDIFESANTQTNDDDISAVLSLVQITKIKDRQNPLFQRLEETERTAAKLPISSQIGFHYGYAKTLEDLGENPAAFSQYQKGATLKRTTLDYSPKDVDALTERIIAASDQKMFDRLARFADPSQTPIFVLGMPRSGTTLTECILASHSEVYGAGELHDLHKALSFSTMDSEHVFPRNLLDLNEATLATRASKYIQALHSRSDGAARVTDKMPANYYLVGFIHALLPNAKIIHVARNPMDVCLSCYTRLFDRSQPHSYDLEELADVYLNYHRLMAHWDAVLPRGCVHKVQYEDLVEHTEEQARALIAHCDLDWEAACLRFFENKRRVRTASVTQVRQSIYKTSNEKWKKYATELTPLYQRFKSAGII